MPVFRVEKNNNYTTMCNHHLRDQTLTLKAKGMLSMILSLPDTWNYSVRGLAAISHEGVDGIVTALKELEAHGYLSRRQLRQPNGRLGQIEYIVYEMPQTKPRSDSPCTEKPYTVSPDTEEPDTAPPCAEMPAQISKEETSKDGSITDLKKERGKGPTRHQYGLYKNVLLSDEELEKLKAEFPTDYQQRIERLSEYMASTGKSYKNHMATIRSWARRDSKQTRPTGYSHENYHYEEGDSL